jgi:hypothetical protein
MDRSRWLLSIVVSTVVSVGAAYFVFAPGTDAAPTARYSLRVGDHLTVPAIGWACDLTTTKPGPALVCSPGTPGTSSQGSPAVSLQAVRLAVATGTKPSAAVVSIGGGKKELIVTFKVGRK